MIINSEKEYLEHFGWDNLKVASNSVFKGTRCGAWVQKMIDGDGLAVGSIVEGTDVETRTYELPFPFTIEEYDDALDMVEDEAEEIWLDTFAYSEDF